MAKTREGICAICGKYKKLSREHFPPEGAFNEGEFKIKSINQYETRGSLVWHEKWRSGGNARYVTCEKCNNDTGGWYARAYNDFAHACQPYARPKNAGFIGYIDTIPFYPLRVVKQAICSILASSDPDETRELSAVCSPARSHLGPPPAYLKDTSAVYKVLPALRGFVLDREAKGLPEGVRLYLYIVAGLAGRSTGFTVMANESEGEYAVFAELAWPPLGWVLLFDGEVAEPIREVTRWAECNYAEQWPLKEISVSCQWAEGDPLDFRSPDAIAKTRERNQGLHA